MNKDLFKRVKETAKELISDLRKFGDGKRVKEYAEKKYQGHIAGEQEFPGELINRQWENNNDFFEDFKRGLKRGRNNDLHK